MRLIVRLRLYVQLPVLFTNKNFGEKVRVWPQLTSQTLLAYPDKNSATPICGKWLLW